MGAGVRAGGPGAAPSIERAWILSVTRTLRPSGDVDIAAVDDLREQWFAVASEQPDCIVIDLSEVSFVDSTGLGVFVGLLKRQREHGGSVVLRGADARAARLLRITGLDEVFPDAQAPAES